jgi:DNA-binding transcriptional ArsR family regulator
MTKAQKLSDAALEQAAGCLRTIAHPARLRMIEVLLDREASVGELAQIVGIAPNAATMHLRLLEHCGMLRRTRQGRGVFYSVAEPHLENILACVRARFAETTK